MSNKLKQPKKDDTMSAQKVSKYIVK